MNLLHGENDDKDDEYEYKYRERGWRNGSRKTVMISPNFDTNQPTLTDCSSGSCETLPTQGSNMVLLHTEPSNTSPLLSGDNRIDNWSSKATAGQRFVVADRQGDWTGIWYGGTIGWFYNPADNPVAAKSRSTVITPRAGRATIPVYGAAYPEAAAYPADVPTQLLTPLYNMPADQVYTIGDKKLPTDYFYAPTINYSLPHDHEVIKGQEKYYQITYNHRIAYVKASDVRINKSF